MTNDKINMVVETKDGRPLRTFAHENRTFVESRESSEYQLRIKNKTNARVMAIIAVDGINVINGKVASDKPDEAGYVLGPYEEHVIKGYRINNQDVALFKFVKREQGYAQDKGNDIGCGVIAVRVWAEKDSELQKIKDLAERWQKKYEEERNKPRKKEYIPYPVYPSYPRDDWYPYRPYWIWRDNWTICGSNQTGSYNEPSWVTYATDNAVGTCQATTCSTVNHTALSSTYKMAEENPFAHASSWGSQTQDAVREVKFEVGDFITQIDVFYAPKEGLKALGIDIDKTKAVTFPQAFKQEYCVPPKNWTGYKG